MDGCMSRENLLTSDSIVVKMRPCTYGACFTSEALLRHSGHGPSDQPFIPPLFPPPQKLDIQWLHKRLQVILQTMYRVDVRSQASVRPCPVGGMNNCVEILRILSWLFYGVFKRASR